MLSSFGKLGCDVTGIQETHCSGQSIFAKAGHTVHCNSESGDEFQEKGQGGFGPAVKQTLGTQTTAGHLEFIGDRLLEMTLDIRGRSKGVSFVVVYAPTETTDVSRKNIFLVALDIAV